MRASLAAALLALVLAPRPAAAQEAYGARGLFPVYVVGGHWMIYDKTDSAAARAALRPGGTFLLIGSSGEGVFTVARTSAAYGGACRRGKPARLRAALLRGPIRQVGVPILAIRAPKSFRLEGSRAVYRALPNAVDEGVYKTLEVALARETIADVKSGAFRFKPGDAGRDAFVADPNPDKILLKIDYASHPKIAGLAAPTVLVDGEQISDSFRRCLYLADGSKLVGRCVEMPHDLMAETALLRFVSYDPSGAGTPLLLAYTPKPPLWGDERWGFVLRAAGPSLFLRDALDPRCRASF
ncbi:MAG: hypothetical protein KGM24_12260 [Elusimicrobia bacterium]|nr:hypothetical protein [Elusimicrobiota bacterium]